MERDYLIFCSQLGLPQRGEAPEVAVTAATPQGPATHRQDLEREAHVVLPCHTQDVGQVQREVDDAPTGCCQVGSGEECADQEALQDGHHGEHGQKDKHHAGVAVGQQVS